eukprot:gene6724-8046_t
MLATVDLLSDDCVPATVDVLHGDCVPATVDVLHGSKHIYLGLFNDEEDAARAYDRALVRLRGTSAATNFALSDYKEELGAYRVEQAAKVR